MQNRSHEISFIDTHILVHLHVNKTNFRMKDFALGLALKQRRKTTRQWTISRLAVRTEKSRYAGKLQYFVCDARGIV